MCRCQFHQHFTHAFFIRKCFFHQNVTREKLRKALLYEKRTRKMMMKLTEGGSVIKTANNETRLYVLKISIKFRNKFIILQPVADPINFFLRWRIIFPFFAPQLGHFTINDFSIYAERARIKTPCDFNLCTLEWWHGNHNAQVIHSHPLQKVVGMRVNTQKCN